jgi:hypothetical protein
VTKKQDIFHWRLWAMLKKARPGVDRKAVYAELGLPESHLCWNNAHFDAWKAHCMAAAEPGNYKTQIGQVKMAATRHGVFIGYLLAALHRDNGYAESILTRMNRRGKVGCKFVTVDTASEEVLKGLIIALKKECRRCWPTKDHLLGAIGRICDSEEYDDTRCTPAVLAALGVQGLPRLDRLPYEHLLIVIGTLHGLCTQSAVAVEAPF